MSKSKLNAILSKNANDRNQGLKTFNEILEKGLVEPFYDVAIDESISSKAPTFDVDMFTDTETSGYDRWNSILNEDIWEGLENELNTSYIGVSVGVDLKSFKPSEREHIETLFKSLFNEAGLHSDLIKVVSMGRFQGRLHQFICDVDNLEDIDEDSLKVQASVGSFFGNCIRLLKHVPWYYSSFQDVVNRLFVVFMDLVRTNPECLTLDEFNGIHFKPIKGKFRHNPVVITVSTMIDELIFFMISIVRAGVHNVESH